MRNLFWLLLMLGMLGQQLDPAEILEETARETEAQHVEMALTEEERQISGPLRLDGAYDLRGALQRLWQRFFMLAKESIKEELGFSAKLVLIGLTCSMGVALSPGGKTSPWVELSCCMAAVLLLSGSTKSVINQAEESLAHLQDYAMAAFPAFYTTLAACGAPGSAAARYAAVQFSVYLFMRLTEDLLLPLIRGYLSLSICCAMFDNALIRGVTKLLKWLSVTGMSLLCSVFCFYIGLTGLISASADAAVVKGTKTVIASTLPVVGGILSDSAGTILAAAAIIKNSAGVFSLVSICVICASPFAVLGAKLLVFKATAALASLTGSEQYCGVLNSFGTVIAMLLGLVGTFGVMLFYAFLSGIRGIGG